MAGVIDDDRPLVQHLVPVQSQALRRLHLGLDGTSLDGGDVGVGNIVEVSVERLPEAPGQSRLLDLPIGQIRHDVIGMGNTVAGASVQGLSLVGGVSPTESDAHLHTPRPSAVNHRRGTCRTIPASFGNRSSFLSLQSLQHPTRLNGL